MVFATYGLLAVGFFDIIWNLLAVALGVISIVLIAIILIQDSKGAGLTSAFGAGPGGESLLGARMQKDVARWTIYISIVFTIIVIVMAFLGNAIYRSTTFGAAGANEPKIEAPAGMGEEGESKTVESKKGGKSEEGGASKDTKANKGTGASTDKKSGDTKK